MPITCITCGLHDGAHGLGCTFKASAVILARSADNNEGVRQRMARDIEKAGGLPGRRWN